jgi:predicted secreted protein
MQMASDYIHPTPRGGRCRIRVYLPDEEHEVDQRYMGTAILGAIVMRTVLITAAIASVILGVILGFTLFIGVALSTEYIEFALALVLFLVIFVGSYWFVVLGQGRRR